MRRLRESGPLRRLVQETDLSSSSLVYPIFIDERIRSPTSITSLPGQSKQSLESLRKEVDSVVSLHIPAVLLFGLPARKTGDGTNSYSKNGILQRAIKVVKENYGDSISVIGDVCVCMYASHGHCGVVRDNMIVNDATLEILKKIAVSQAEAGIDIVAPSGMVDGQVGAIRGALDDSGYPQVGILSYTAKFLSNLYGPFRDIAQSAPSFRDRSSYQLSPYNLEEAMREIRLDIQEGADVVMVKPAIYYLDVVREARSRFKHPIAAFSVGAEYFMIKALVKEKLANERDLVIEVLSSIKRSGANMIITYFAKDVAQWIRESAN